jgi:UDP-N-acetylglucosamine 4,6-dehydratase
MAIPFFGSLLDWPYKTVLITGGTGTFGQACLHTLLTYEPECKIRIFSRDEYKQARLRERYPEPQISWLLGDVRDIERLHLACRGCDLVLHAAALKHVPSSEYNPLEAVNTNILGTSNVIKSCINCRVKQAVFLSSDKAVEPVNLYGASKMVAEKLFVQANHYSDQGVPRFVVTRYGNVMGSRGSVVDLFYRYHCEGKPLPVTDLCMTRFWMTIDEAVRLVLFAASQRLMGGIVVPSLSAFGMDDLCKAVLGRPNLLACSNATAPIPEADVTITGVRPGEKRHERLLTWAEHTGIHYYALDARDSVGLYYFVRPPIQFWRDVPLSSGWHPGPDGILEDHAYASDEWPMRLAWEDMHALLPDVYEGLCHD